MDKNFASESGHWYRPDGAPAYTTTGSNGKERPTTLRDARKVGLVPSVTMICNVASKPALEIWKQKQILLAALTLPRRDGESEDDFAVRAIQDSKEQSRTRAEEGSAIHGSIEKAISGKYYDAKHAVFVQPVLAVIKKYSDGWSAEKSFASDLGYGGKVDAHAPGYVIDFKTKEFGEADDRLAWPEQAMQLGAYRDGLGMGSAACANVFISVSSPGLIKVHEWSEDALILGFEKFLCLLNYWKLDKGV